MHARSAILKCALLLAMVALWPPPSSAQTLLSAQAPAQHTPPERVPLERPASGQKLTVTVTDQNAVAVASARVQLQPPPPALPLRCETDFAGHCEFSNFLPGTYELRVEKAGYYAAVQSGMQV